MTEASLKPGWTKVKFGEVVRLCKDRSSDPEADGIERYVGLEHLEPEDLRIRRWGLVADGTTFTSRFKPGQVLFGKRRAYQRKVAVANFEGVCSGDIYVLESVSPKILLPKLLPYICQTECFFEYAVGTSAGSLSPRTNWKSLKNYEFLLPPIDLQEKLIHSLLSIDRSRESLMEAKIKREALYFSRLEHEVKHYSKSGVKNKPLEEVCDAILDGTHKTPTYTESGIPFLRVTDINADEIDWFSVKRISEEEHHELCKRCKPEKGDILLSKNGTIGITRVVDWEAEFSIFVSLCLLKPKKVILPGFLSEMLNSSLAKIQLILRIKQGTVKNLHLEEIRKCSIPVPGLKKQKHFLEEIFTMNSSNEALNRRLLQIEQFRKKFLSQQLEL